MALDLGMAKARGLVAPVKGAEEYLTKQAGGAGVFKSEDWWNKQYDTIIRKGLPQTSSKTEYFTRPITMPGNYSPGKWVGPAELPGGGLGIPTNAMYTGGYGQPKQYKTRQVEVTTQKDLTQAELDSITEASKAATRRAQAELEKLKTSRKRLSRGTGGLVAKAVAPGAKVDTGLPDLGSTGLGLGTAMLGEMQKL